DRPHPRMPERHAQARAALGAGEVIEPSRVVLVLALVHESGENRVRRHRSDGGAVLGCKTVKPGARRRATGARHVPDHDRGPSGYRRRKMLGIGGAKGRTRRPTSVRAMRVMVLP